MDLNFDFDSNVGENEKRIFFPKENHRELWDCLYHRQNFIKKRKNLCNRYKLEFPQKRDISPLMTQRLPGVRSRASGLGRFVVWIFFSCSNSRVWRKSKKKSVGSQRVSPRVSCFVVLPATGLTRQLKMT